MKKALLALLGILATAAVGMAFTQDGMARVMQADGLVAASPFISPNTPAWINNPDTGEWIEVVVDRWVPPGGGRIIEISPDAALALGIPEGGSVHVTTVSPPLPSPLPPVFIAAEPEPEPPAVAAAPEPPPPAPPPPPEPEPPPAAPPEPPPPAPPPPLAAAFDPAPLQPVTITIHNYIVIPDAPAPERPMRRRPAEFAAPEPMPPPVAALPPPAPPPPPPAPPPLPPPPPPEPAVEVIPGLPDPHGNRLHRLQVGSYSGIGSASIAMRQVEAAGFYAAQEQHGGWFRVMAVGVHSSNVQAAVQRLGAMGFTQIWVRE